MSNKNNSNCTNNRVPQQTSIQHSGNNNNQQNNMNNMTNNNYNSTNNNLNSSK
jgi:hypothetical protein